MASKQVRLPLTASYNTRVSATQANAGASSIAGLAIAGIAIAGASPPSSVKDSRLVNCFNETVSDPITGEKKIYCTKRPGWAELNTPAAGSIGTAISVWSGYSSGNSVISAFGGTNSTLYNGTASLGAITGKATDITESFVSTDPVLAITSTDNTGWTTSGPAVSGSLTFTADTNSDTSLANISSTAGLVVGQLLTGSGIDANTRIASIDSATAATLTVATTATASGVTITRTILGKIVNANFPGNAGLTLAGTFVHLDGYALVMDTNGVLWASDLNTVTGWTATSFGSANSYPDKGVGAIRYKQYVMAFGTQSVEFFYNAGQTPFPLVKATTMTVKVGAIAAAAITSISDTVFWCGSTPQGGLSIFQYDGGVQRVSIPEIDGILLIAGANAITLTSVRFFGRSFIVCIVGTRTMVYCVEEKSWHEWVSGTAVLWYKCAAISVGSTMVNYAVSNTSTGGKVYTMNQAALVYTDDSMAYTATPQLALMDFGTRRNKFFDSMSVIADQESSTSDLSILYSDDDYQTFSIWGTVDLSTSDPIARRLGKSRRRGWAFAHSAATPMRIEAIELNVRIGSV